jgi:hypothetical protein
MFAVVHPNLLTVVLAGAMLSSSPLIDLGVFVLLVVI